MLALDAGIVYASYFIALLLRFGREVPGYSWRLLLQVGPVIALGYIVANFVFGAYRAAWRNGVREIVYLAAAVLLVKLIVFAVNFTFQRRDIPLSVNLMGGDLISLSMCLTRLWPNVRHGHPDQL